MPKKHRVKRQNYVDHLRRLEKERDAYLAKRRAPKRSREARGDEEATGEARDSADAGVMKKRRTEADVSPPVSTAKVEAAAAPETSGAATAAAPEKSSFFSLKPFSELAKSSAAAAQRSSDAATDTPAVAAAGKKTLKRRHY
ncbi:hypothetical protein NESM_000027200 [Novymonas esmeraldas]|uniref:Uncharacterized protein n=1 Tax=Novymonas esmeraldas TaxID=1808958 RepID=A0AAW0EZM2_9TRYP